MAIVVQNPNPTLLDLARAMPAGAPQVQVVELLNQQNDFWDEATVIPTNKDNTHFHKVRTGLPKGQWTQLYQGITPSKGDYAAVEEGCGRYEALNEVDVRFEDELSAEAFSKYRYQEAKGMTEGITQDVSNAFFYGNLNTDPLKFMGLSERYNTKTLANSATAQAVYDAEGAGTDNRSIWLICWDEEATSLIYPRNSMAGLQRRDGGRQTIQVGDNARMEVYQEWWKWYLGLSVADWRCNARICNIDLSDLKGGTGSFAFAAAATMPEYFEKILFLFDLMDRATTNLPKGAKTKRCVWYMSSEVAYGIARMAKRVPVAGTFEVKDINGVMVNVYNGYPIRICDALAVDEARVV